MIALTLICAYRALDRPSAGRAALLGAVAGLAALTRGEALLLVPLLRHSRDRGGGGPASRSPPGLRGVRRSFSLRGRCATSSAFDRPVLRLQQHRQPAGRGQLPRHVRRPPARRRGRWRASSYPPHESEARIAARLRRRGIDYIQGRTARFLQVGVIRVLRTWDFFRPRQQIELSGQEARDTRVERIGVIVYYPLLALAIWGAVLLRRRRETLLVLLAPAAMVTIMSFLGYGITRFRMAAEISIVVLAAVALVGARRARAGGLRVAPAARQRGHPRPDGRAASPWRSRSARAGPARTRRSTCTSTRRASSPTWRRCGRSERRPRPRPGRASTAATCCRWARSTRVGDALGLSPWVVAPPVARRAPRARGAGARCGCSTRCVGRPRGVAHIVAGVLIVLNPYVVVFTQRARA